VGKADAIKPCIDKTNELLGLSRTGDERQCANLQHLKAVARSVARCRWKDEVKSVRVPGGKAEMPLQQPLEAQVYVFRFGGYLKP
jgi:hypothetical protein